MKMESLDKEKIDTQSKIIPFPTKPETKKELTSSETYDAIQEAIHILDCFRKEGKHYPPLYVYGYIMGQRIAKKYGEV